MMNETRPFAYLATLWGLASALTACTNNALNLRTLGTAADKPSHVSVYLAATRGEQPVTGLNAEDFTIYEQGQALDASETQQTLLPRESAAAHRVLLLMDVSAATPEDVRRELAQSEELFVETARRTQAVSVYAFDGGANIRLLSELDRETKPTKLSTSLAPRPRDTSRNLNGAVVQALDQLDAKLANSSLPLKVGTLVVFSGGGDLAGRVSPSELGARLEKSTALLITIGIGENAELQRLGRNGYVDAHSKDTLSLAFEDAAHRVDADSAKYYLLSYCSPARAEHRQVRIELKVLDDKGKPETGSAQTEFDATGFSPGCDAHATPHFARPKALSTPHEARTFRWAAGAVKRVRSHTPPALAPARAELRALFGAATQTHSEGLVEDSHR